MSKILKEIVDKELKIAESPSETMIEKNKLKGLEDKKAHIEAEIAEIKASIAARKKRIKDLKALLNGSNNNA